MNASYDFTSAVHDFAGWFQDCLRLDSKRPNLRKPVDARQVDEM